MSARTTHFDTETVRPLARNAPQPRSRSEGRYDGSREARGAHRSRTGANDVEPTEVSISHKKAHGKISEKAQSLKISKARAHAASAIGSESSPHSLDYVSSPQQPLSRNTQDYSPKASSNLYASMHMADSERKKFMDNIPGIPVNEQLATQRGDRPDWSAFPPPSVSKYGQNVAYSTSLPSDLKSLPRDSNNTTELVFHKSSANRHTKGLRLKGHAETEMQWNVTQENNFRLRDEQRNRSASSDYHYSRTRGRRSKDGVNVVYNDVKFSGPNRQNVSRRSTSTSSYSESPTDSQGSSTESESFSSSDSSHKRRRRIRRKPSNKSIGSSIYGEDNTSESENQSVSEPSASDNMYSHNKSKNKFAPEELASLGPLVTYKEHRNTTNRLRSSSLTSVSSLEGAGISTDAAASRNESSLISPTGTRIAKVKKIQIRSFTSFADSQLNNKENLPQRRRSSEEREPLKIRGRAETAPRDIPRASLPRQGSESPSLSRSPFSLKSKALVRKTSRESQFSDSECNLSPDKGNEKKSLDTTVEKEQVTRCNSAPPDPLPSESREPRLHQSLLSDNSMLLTSRSAFVPVKPTKRANDLEPNPSIIDPVSFAAADSRLGKVASTAGEDTLLRPVARIGNRPLSIVQETDEFSEIVQQDVTYKNESLVVRSSQELRGTPPCMDENTSLSTLRRLSYVRAQTNSADLPVHLSDLSPVQMLGLNSSSDSPTSFSPLFAQDLQSSRYISEAANETKKVLKEFDPLTSNEILRTVTEGDLISFDDENGDVKEPVKKRTKRITRPKIPTILGGEDADNSIDMESFEVSTGLPGASNVSLSKDISGMFDGPNRDTIIAHDSEEESTPRAASDAEDNQTAESHFNGSDVNKKQTDSLFDVQGDSVEDINQRPKPRKKLQKRASLPVIRTEFYQEEVRDNDEAPSLEEIPKSPSLRKAETINDLSLDQVAHHLKVDSLQGIGTEPGKDFLFLDDKSLESCSPPPGATPSPSPSQMNFDALSLTTSGFSETHSEEVSTGDLNVGYDLLQMDSTVNNKSVDDAWRSQSDPSHGIQLENTMAELQAHRNSNSEPNLNGEKLKEESEQLAKRVNGGNQVAPKRKTHGIKEDECEDDVDENDDDKDNSLADLSPDDGCYELDKPDIKRKPLHRAKSAPTPTTLSSPRTQRIANSFAVEKAQAKLNKLAAMETIMELPNAEPSVQIPEKPKVEKAKRSSSVEGGITSPTPSEGTCAKEDKRRLSISKEPGKSQKSKHVSTLLKPAASIPHPHPRLSLRTRGKGFSQLL